MRGSHFSNKRLRKTVYIMKSQEVEKFLKLIEEVKKNLNSISFYYFKTPVTPLYYIPFLHAVPMEDNT